MGEQEGHLVFIQVFGKVGRAFATIKDVPSDGLITSIILVERNLLGVTNGSVIQILRVTPEEIFSDEHEQFVPVIEVEPVMARSARRRYAASTI